MCDTADALYYKYIHCDSSFCAFCMRQTINKILYCPLSNIISQSYIHIIIHMTIGRTTTTTIYILIKQ